ncbi:MAG: PUR family DNA/RNA-binding protein [Bacteroidales bacterium]|jgi:hypothetical protein|nr:PUR family DNA/RNA-binding protein [Bacteroidales bacterium]
MENREKKRDEVYSNSVKAGKRTYFFDVRENRNGDYYLTITESKKRYEDDGSFKFEKHKIYLYREDFQNFLDGYKDVVEYIKNNKPEYFEETAKTDEIVELNSEEVTKETPEE